MIDRAIGIMGAMPEEIDSIIELLSEVKENHIGGRIYYEGYLKGIKTIVVFSRWGKVAAAATVTTLLIEFKITELIFSGVAGAIHPDLNIGDVVIGKKFFQHDMDARPLMKEFEIPLLGVSHFESPQEKVTQVERTIKEVLNQNHLHKVIKQKDLDSFNIQQPKLFIGDIASGDKFFSKNKDKELLQDKLPSILCVEMEGAAVAQICYEYDIPFTIIRTISDAADENAAIDFPSFIKDISSKYSREIISLYFKNL